MSDPTAASFRELIGVTPSTASPKDSTLVIIDAQNEYAKGKLATIRKLYKSRLQASVRLHNKQHQGRSRNVVLEII